MGSILPYDIKSSEFFVNFVKNFCDRSSEPRSGDIFVKFCKNSEGKRNPPRDEGDFKSIYGRIDMMKGPDHTEIVAVMVLFVVSMTETELFPPALDA